MRIIRRHGTPVPDSEKGSVGGYSVHEEEEPTNVLSTFKNAFKKAGREEAPRRAISISGPYPAS
jgi:tagatose-1,6-bisphosphate aldolase non-catalytic subunit AgaZ/GatZ